jgi:hypothetical protein
MTFDPNKFLAETKPVGKSFDPNKFLAETKPSNSLGADEDKLRAATANLAGDTTDTLKTVAGAASEGLGQGFAGEIHGALDSPIGAYKKALNLAYKPILGTEYQDEDTQKYDTSRKSYEDELNRLKEKNPALFTTTQMISGMGAVPIMGATKGIAGAAKVGGIAGGLMGAGGAEDIHDVPVESFKGLGYGMGLGAGVPLAIKGGAATAQKIKDSAKGVGNFVADIPVISRLAEIAKREYGGERLTGTSRLRQALDDLHSVSKNASGQAKKLSDDIGTKIGELKESGKDVPVEELETFLSGKLKEVEKLPDASTADFNAKNELRDTITNLLKGREVTKPVIERTAGAVKTIPAKQSSNERLQPQLKKYINKANEERSGKTYEIVESTGEGQKYSTLIEHSPVEEIGGKNILGGKKVIEAIPFEEGIPEQTITEDASEILRKIITREKPQPKTAEGLIGVTESVRPMTSYGGELENADAARMFANKLVKESNEMLATKNAELAAKNKLYGESQDVLKLANQKKPLEPGTSRAGQEIENTRNISQLIIDSQLDTPVGSVARDKLDVITKIIKNLSSNNDPMIQKQAAAVQEQFNNAIKAADKMLLIGKVVEEGGVAGQVIARHQLLGYTAALPARGAGAAVRGISNTIPEVIKDLSANIASGTVKGAKKVLSSVKEAAKKDDKGRNAAIFALEQNPAFREAVRKEK